MTRADAGLRHLRRRGDADEPSCRRRARCSSSSTAPTDMRAKTHPRDRRTQDGRVTETAEDTPPDLDESRSDAQRTPAITHVFAVHCETTSGILNPIEEIGALRGARWPAATDRFDERLRRAAARCARRCHATRWRRRRTSASRACPGFGFVICRRAALEASQGQRARRSSLDLLRPVVRISRRPGNTASRRRPMSSSRLHRRSRNARRRGRRAGSRRALPRTTAASWSRACAALGFKPLLPAALQAPIIVTFHMPARSALRLPALLRRAEGARFRHLSGQADGRRSRSASAASAGSASARCTARSMPFGNC